MTKIHRRIVQKGLNDPDNHDGVVTHQETDILECKVKWSLGSIAMNKASGDNGISVESEAAQSCPTVCDTMDSSLH